jgi:hypothetical protein
MAKLPRAYRSQGERCFLLAESCKTAGVKMQLAALAIEWFDIADVMDSQDRTAKKPDQCTPNPHLRARAKERPAGRASHVTTPGSPPVLHRT